MRASSQQPLVTVIIPSYNHAQYIEQAIESVLNQTYPHIELIIVDDGSKDNSHEVIQRHVDGSRVRAVLNKENRGHVAIHDGLDIANGEFVSFLPSDDWYLPQKTELQVAKFLASADDVGVVYGKGQRFYESTGETHDVKLPMYRGDVLKQLIGVCNFVYPVTPMFRKCVFDSIRFDPGYTAEGEAVYLKIALDWKFDFVEEFVGVMRDHAYNAGKDIDLRVYDDAVRLWTNFFNRDDIPALIKQLRSRKLAAIHRSKGISRLLYHRDFESSRRILAAGINESKSLLADRGVMASLLLCYLPRSFANYILDLRGGATVAQPARSTQREPSSSKSQHT